VKARATAKRIPHHLRIHVRVSVDKAWRNNQAISINRTTSSLVQLTDGNNSSVFDTKVSRAARRTGTIDQASTANQIIQHLTTPLSCSDFTINAY
jgi:hypothetical protein